MDMKKLTFVAVLSVFVATQVFAASLVVTPRSVAMIAKENESVKGYAKVITPSGFEKKVRIENIPDWLKVEPTEFMIDRANPQKQVALTASASGLKVGEYNANLRIKNANENDKPEFVILPVILTVIPAKNELTATPRSIEVKPGISRSISVYNPTGEDIKAKVTSSSFWIVTYPETIDIPAKRSAVIWAKMSDKYLPGGNYTSTIDCVSPIGKLQIPVKTIIDSGLEFNPDSISDSGPITITNKLKRSVVVKPTQIEGVSFDLKKIDLAEGKSKIIKVTFTSDKKPDYLKFSITGGLNICHNVKVNK